MKPKSALWRLSISGAVAIILYFLLVGAITQPVHENTRSYVAEFTDASGLHRDADVRIRGVRVGKVRSIELRRKDGQSVASVEFTLDERYGVVTDTRLAIKYQALTGLRYVDVYNPAENHPKANLVTHVTTAMTQPSFDVTTLFNGLQPVIATLSPDEINTFVENSADFLEGDGSGLAPMLDSVRKLAKFASDREMVIATLMRNLNEIATSLGGHAKDLVQILDWLHTQPINAAMNVLDEFRKTQLFGVGFTDPVVQLLTNIGIPPRVNSGLWFVQGPDAVKPNPSDVDYGLDKAGNVLDDFMDAVKLVPVVWENIPPPPEGGAPLQCSRGRAQLPEQMDILLKGRRVVLCNR